MDLGSYLIQVRNERGYSQRDLAEKSGVSPAEISRVESGKRQKPSPAVLRAIADTLVISYPYLMQLAGYMDETAPDEAPATEDVFRDESTGCHCPPGLPVCRCGHTASLRIVTRKPVPPGEAELARNRRSACAKLRAAEKIV